MDSFFLDTLLGHICSTICNCLAFGPFQFECGAVCGAVWFLTFLKWPNSLSDKSWSRWPLGPVPFVYSSLVTITYRLGSDFPGG